MKELKKALWRAQHSVAELISYFPDFPDQSRQDDELKLIVQAGQALDKLERKLQELWGKEWGK